jgi:membrane-associated phospholipid phosphatase
MTGNPDPEPPLDLPGPWRTAAVPLVAAALAAWVALAGSNTSLFRALNAWPLATGDALWLNLTKLGEGVVLLAASAVFIGRRPRTLWATVLCGVLVFLTVHSLKEPFDVARPVRALGDETVHVIGARLTSNSFPSGHSTSIFAVAGLAFALVRRPGWRALILAAAAVIAASRLVVGAHWPLDVLVGAALGWIVATVALHLAQHWSSGMGPRGRLVVAALPLLAALYVCVPDEDWAPIQLVIGLGALAAGLPGFVRLCRSSRSVAGPMNSH